MFYLAWLFHQPFHCMGWPKIWLSPLSCCGHNVLSRYHECCLKYFFFLYSWFMTQSQQMASYMHRIRCNLWYFLNGKHQGISSCGLQFFEYLAVITESKAFQVSNNLWNPGYVFTCMWQFNLKLVSHDHFLFWAWWYFIFYPVLPVVWWMPWDVSHAWYYTWVALLSGVHKKTILHAS